MIQSRLALGTIFLGPFIILVLINGIYSTSDNSNLNIGVIINIDSDLSESFNERLRNEAFKIIEFGTVEACVNNLKHEKVDICAEFTGNIDKQEINFHVEYSKIKLVTILTNALTAKVKDQADNLQVMFMEQLMDKMREFSDMIKNLGREFNNVLKQSPTNRIVELKANLNSSASLTSSAKGSLEQIKSDSSKRYSETDSSLDRFLADLRDIRSKGNAQVNEIRVIKEYNSDCESKYLPDINDNLDSISENEEETIQLLKDYGTCKCVDYYRPRLTKLEQDLTETLGYINDIEQEVIDAKASNRQFFNSINSIIDSQEGNLDQFDKQRDDSTKQLDQINEEMNQQMQQFSQNINQVVSKTDEISSEVGIDSGDLVKPVSIKVKPISAVRELNVYLFPMVYFLVLMFISLVFSSTFSFSEKESLATNRNVLSPLNNLIHVLGMYISLLLIITVQGIFIILMGNVYFTLEISLIAFLKIVAVSMFMISMFILLGIFIGRVFKSQLIVMLISIAITIIMFLYSDLLRPTEMMASTARFIITINPFVMGSSTVSNLILFNSDLAFVLKDFIGILIVEAFILIGAIMLCYLLEEE